MWGWRAALTDFWKSSFRVQIKPTIYHTYYTIFEMFRNLKQHRFHIDRLTVSIGEVILFLNIALTTIDFKELVLTYS